MLILLIFISGETHAERIKDLASIRGVRENQLIGYGLVAGLDGSGDQTTQTPFTTQSIISMMQQLGVSLPPGTSLQLKNIAAVMVTASLPAFAQPGQLLDVTVSSMGNAKSLSGGTLLMTPLKGADNKVYAMAQGNVLVGGVGAAAAGSKAQINHLSVGRISAGATVERAVPSTLGSGEMIHLELNTSDFSTATRIVNVLNQRFGAETAMALDSRVIKVRAPIDADSRVAFIGDLESLDVNPAQMAAKVILNARTGSIVMNQAVTLDSCAVAHGNLQVIINAESKVSQPNALAAGKTEVTEKADIEIKKEPGLVVLVKAGVSLAEVVKALNSIGATPQDLLAILQAMKVSGALRAELEII
ncbi:flagellar basal body P-ring protein FlgI [Solimicrobium silvestre]|nr:flagellar basal body P-ring protein FlgI [Solimicrobium silvestre]